MNSPTHNRIRVYIAGPLSSSGDRRQNVKRAMQAALELIRAGYSPLCPHLTDALDPTDSLGHETWIQVCLPWVRVSQAVLRLSGPSKGADRECEEADWLDIPVVRSIDELAEIPFIVECQQPSHPNRIYLVGAHSTGKTTLARWIARTYDLPLVTEVVRSILGEQELTLESMDGDIDAWDQFQRQVFPRQIEAESKHPDGFVSDRAFDNIAYAALKTRIAGEVFNSARYANYVHSLKQNARIFFVRPHPELIRADGVRTDLDLASVYRIDGMIQQLLETSGLNYVPVDSMNMRDRIRLVEAVLGTPRAKPCPSSRPPNAPAKAPTNSARNAMAPA